MSEPVPEQPAPEPEQPFEAPAGVPEPEPEPEEHEPEQPEPEPEPEQPEGPEAMSAKELDQLHDKLEKEARRHAGRVSEILGEQALALELCPLCLPAVPGFRYPVPPDPETIAHVKAALGEPPEPEYRPASNAAMCEDCAGYGKRLSGSKVPDQKVLLCHVCGGKGWRPQGTLSVAAAAPVGNGQPDETPQLAPESMPATDPWGRTPDDVDYGRLPNYVRP